ncbi:hypothetical protein ACFWAR_20075 [Streptomyces sp. NPDC059917]|uniref:hypothetical protein n=1 Tax=Streptomyces sp. NPDC059917 TaxID=3347002 RepID=UPI0036511481
MAIRSAARLADLMDAAGFTDVDEAEPPAGEWQFAEFGDADGRSLARLVEATGAPAIVVDYLDSDVGFVRAAAPDGSGWRGLLDRETATDYDVPVDRYPVAAAISGALAWSAAAGLTADEPLIRRALTESAVFAEQLTALLFAGLGIPGTEQDELAAP